jgi:hypothetical protein
VKVSGVDRSVEQAIAQCGLALGEFNLPPLKERGSTTHTRW